MNFYAIVPYVKIFNEIHPTLKPDFHHFHMISQEPLWPRGTLGPTKGHGSHWPRRPSLLPRGLEEWTPLASQRGGGSGGGQPHKLSLVVTLVVKQAKPSPTGEPFRPLVPLGLPKSLVVGRASRIATMLIMERGSLPTGQPKSKC